MINFSSIWNNLLKHCVSAKFRLMEDYVQGALRKELHIATFVECFKQPLWEDLADKFCQYLEQIT